MAHVNMYAQNKGFTHRGLLMVQCYTPRWFTRHLQLGDFGDDVAVVQRKVGMKVTGLFDEETEARVRGIQLGKKLKKTGKVDEDTAKAIGPEAREGQVPHWFTFTQQLWHEGDDVRCARGRLGLNDDNRFDPDMEAAVRRLQSSEGLPVTGQIDEATAILIGEGSTCEH